MKKTFTANLNGTVFHIEEDAYDQLQRYLANIRAKFSGSSEAEEIMADIEARIAELFTERLQGRQAVSVADVDHVKQVMGQPEDYVDGDGGEEASGTDQRSYQQAGPRKHKRLFRDPEDKKVAGVLSGLGHYFGTDPLWLRIVFLILVLAGWGMPAVIYLVMWALIPEALTAAEKLEMHGEAVTVDNIKRMFDEGTEQFKAGASRMAGEAREMGRRYWREGQAQGRDAGARMEHAGHRLIDAVGKVIGVALLLLSLILGLSLVAALVGSTAAWSNGAFAGGTGLMGWGGFIFPSAADATGFILAAVLLCLVPVILLLLASLWLIFRVRTPRWAGWALTLTFIAALAACIWTSIRLAMDFRGKAVQRSELVVPAPASGTLEVQVREPDLAGITTSYHQGFSYANGIIAWNYSRFSLDGDTIHFPFARLEVGLSPDTAWHLVTSSMARGESPVSAGDRAAHIRTRYSWHNDTLSLAARYAFPVKDRMRAQRVVHTLQVPLGGRVHFNPGTQALMSDPMDPGHGAHELDDDMVGGTWTMTTNGLKEASRDALPAPPAPQAPEPSKVPETPARRTISTAPQPATMEPQTPNLLHLLANFIRP